MVTIETKTKTTRSSLIFFSEFPRGVSEKKFSSNVKFSLQPKFIKPSFG